MTKALTRLGPVAFRWRRSLVSSGQGHCGQEGSVPLSEHEQRLLEQIEQALYAEDPKFAHSWRARANVRGIRRQRILRGVVAIIVGLVLLVAGVIVQGSNTVVGVALGVAGFLMMLGGAWLAMSTRQRPVLQAIPSGQDVPKAARARGPKRGIIQRLEDRWKNRQENQGRYDDGGF